MHTHLLPQFLRSSGSAPGFHTIRVQCVRYLATISLVPRNSYTSNTTTTTSQGSKFTIPLLTERNHTTWLIDLRAILRNVKLWPNTQLNYVEFAKAYPDVKITQNQYDEYSMEAADTLVPLTSTLIKKRLSLNPTSTTAIPCYYGCGNSSSPSAISNSCGLQKSSTR